MKLQVRSVFTGITAATSASFTSSCAHFCSWFASGAMKIHLLSNIKSCRRITMLPSSFPSGLRHYRKLSYLCASANQCWGDQQHCSKACPLYLCICQALICIYCRGGRNMSWSLQCVWWWQISEIRLTQSNPHLKQHLSNFTSCFSRYLTHIYL